MSGQKPGRTIKSRLSFSTVPYQTWGSSRQEDEVGWLRRKRCVHTLSSSLSAALKPVTWRSQAQLNHTFSSGGAKTLVMVFPLLNWSQVPCLFRVLHPSNFNNWLPVVCLAFIIE